MTKSQTCSNKCLSITSWALVVMLTILGLFFTCKALAMPFLPRVEGKLTQEQIKHYMDLVEYNIERANHLKGIAEECIWYLSFRCHNLYNSFWICSKFNQKNGFKL